MPKREEFKSSLKLICQVINIVIIIFIINKTNNININNNTHVILAHVHSWSFAYPGITVPVEGADCDLISPLVHNF